MATYTPNYGLHQWAPEDKFLRTDFNEDFSKLDTALKAAEGEIAAAEARSTERLAVVGHDVYNLMLQSHYDGKVTGWKKALVFDGFQDKNLVAEASNSLAFLDREVGLGRTAQNSISLGYGAQPLFLSNIRKTPVRSSLGYALLTGIKVKTQVQYVEQDSAKTNYQVDINNVEAASGQSSLVFQGTPLEQTVLFSSPVMLCPGDSVTVSLSFSANSCMVFPSAGGTTDLGGTLLITPLYGETGTITTPALTLPVRQSCRAWVRHMGGQVALTVRDQDGAETPLPAVGSRTTVNAAGNACVEREFYLPNAPQSETLAFSLNLQLGESDAMQVYDYGILLL
ncbi:hypothetical protein [Intestinimonas sp. HCP28S3_D6]|uniref:hypothetical protein n=1 Tax=Intestinimonas sp. HCP28S3_D6 TaxID=3438942 RepID=UPI003F88698D